MLRQISHLLITLVLVSTAAILTYGQTTSACPTVTVNGPAGEIYPGDMAWFSIDPKLLDITGLIFQWTVSSGTIVSGQGKAVIQVATDERSRGTSIVATVEISGLPEGCKNLASETAGIKLPGDPPLLEEYGNLPLAEERERLNTVVVEWSKNPSWYLYFILNSDAKDPAAAYDARVERIKKYLTANKSLPAERLVFVNGGSFDHRTKIYGVPPDPRELAAKGCPSLSINGPAGIVAEGDIARYTAKIDLVGSTITPRFQWTTSVGEIVSGQGTNTIEVRQPDRIITATVEVSGLPPECPNIASEVSFGDPAPQAMKIGGMSNTTPPDLEVVRRFRDELRANPNNQGFIFLAYPPNLPKAKIAARENAIRDLLTKERLMGDFDGSRITLVQATSKRDITEFWRVPPGASNPTCESCDYVRGCSSIGIERKSGIVKAGDVVVFSVKDRAAVEGLSFYWTVRNGKIESGQGTSSIRVRPTTYITRPVTATLKVRGLPEGCADTFEESYAIPCHPYLATSVDVSFWSEYRNVPWTRERKEIESLFSRALRRQPEKIAYIEKGFPLNSTVRERDAAIRRIQNYVHTTLRIPRGKLFVRPSIGRSATRLYLVPDDSPALSADWKDSCSP